jgi:hypothetical protein
MLIFVAPASRLFSSSSFTTDAGRSTTSPAAIWLTSCTGIGCIRLSVVILKKVVLQKTSSLSYFHSTMKYDAAGT